MEVQASSPALSGKGDHSGKGGIIMLDRRGFLQAIFGGFTAAQIDDLVGKSPNLQGLYLDGIKELDEAARKLSGGRAFVELSDWWKVETLKAIEATPFFKNVYSNTIAFFYGNPKVWREVGYPGPSHRELGGYIARGFDRLEW